MTRRQIREHIFKLLFNLDFYLEEDSEDQMQLYFEPIPQEEASRLFREDSGQWPVLLLDDVLSELDARRQDFVLRRITGGQVFITGCEPPEGVFPEGKLLHIHGGRLAE